MQKVLVTGGAGFLGSFLIKELIRRDNEVIAFDNGFRSGFDNLNEIKESINIIKGDISNYNDWSKLPSDIDFAFHLAAINGTRYFYEIPEHVIDVNTSGTINFMKWVRNTGIKRVFFASSSEVYGFPRIYPTPETEPMIIPDPTNARFSYSASKILGESATINFARAQGINFTIGRFHNIYGPHMGLEHVIPEFITRIIKNQEFIIQGDGKEKRCFCYISDAIDGLIEICEQEQGKNEIFNIGTNEEVSIDQLIDILEEVSGVDLVRKYKHFPHPGTNRRYPDLTKIKKTGYEPKVSLKEGLKKTFEWYEEYYKQN